MGHDIQSINKAVISCRQCPRLVEWREWVATHKVRRFRHEEYWGKPLTGFGDPHAQVVIIGLAPAAHGGNRTGRMFTGDDSGTWLMDALYESGFASQRSSEHPDDGLILSNAYVTAAVRCAPPKNKPTRQEAANCFHFLENELNLIQPRIVIVLGRFAYDSFRQYLASLGIEVKPPLKFAHGCQKTWMVNTRYYVGITPDIVSRSRDRELFSLLPPEAVVVETDSPWPHNGHKPSSPAEITELIATLNHIAPESCDWLRQTTHNARQLFGNIPSRQEQTPIK